MRLVLSRLSRLPRSLLPVCFRSDPQVNICLPCYPFKIIDLRTPSLSSCHIKKRPARIQLPYHDMPSTSLKVFRYISVSYTINKFTTLEGNMRLLI